MRKQLVFFTEERSAETMLEIIVPRLLGENSEIQFLCFPFEGKNDLDQSLQGKITSYRNPNAVFLVIRDKDRGNCEQIKNNLINKIPEDKKPRSLIRIACCELESFYLGDLPAVAKGMDLNLRQYFERSKYQNPDRLVNASQELEKLTKMKYYKIAGSRAIAPHLDLEGNNKSHSFNVLIEGIKRQLARLSP